MKKCLCLVALALWAFGATPADAQQPDLQLTGLAITSPATLHCGMQAVSYTVTETNGGAARSTRHYLDLLKSDGVGSFHPVCRTMVGGLLAGQSAIRSISCTFYNGPCDCLPTAYNTTFQTFTDSLNNVPESNEANNLSNAVVVAAQCP